MNSSYFKSVHHRKNYPETVNMASLKRWSVKFRITCTPTSGLIKNQICHQFLHALLVSLGIINVMNFTLFKLRRYAQ